MYGRGHSHANSIRRTPIFRLRITLETGTSEEWSFELLQGWNVILLMRTVHSNRARTKVTSSRLCK